jgi:hypothetical protein
MMMTNGVGAWLGSKLSGFIIDKYFIEADGSRNWPGIWQTFSLYALVVAIIFSILFKHKHNPAQMESLSH